MISHTGNWKIRVAYSNEMWDDMDTAHSVMG